MEHGDISGGFITGYIMHEVQLLCADDEPLPQKYDKIITVKKGIDSHMVSGITM